jgi:cytochrome P450
LNSLPIEQLDISRGEYFKDETARGLFRRLRAEAPVHFCAHSDYGAYWSITSHRHIQEVLSQPLCYSSASANGGVSIFDAQDAGVGDDGTMEMFLMTDPPRHAAKRRVVAPAFTPSEMQRLAAEIRRRTGEKLDALPRGETFDWTSEVAVSLTTDMLATLFDFPWEDRHRLPVWSDAVTSIEMMKNDPQGRQALMFEMAMKFFGLWQARLVAEPGPDLLSRMIHSDALSKMDQKEFVGNMALLVVGGNDTTRNSMSALIDVIHRWPQQWDKIKADRALIPGAASELLRWYSPVVHVRRTVMEDHEFHGTQFRKGDKVIVWIISGNRDEAVFADPDLFIADRSNSRRHIAFGHGIHRCVGARLAELQLQVLMEEMADRDMRIELVGEIVREGHILVNAINSVPVRIAA